MSGRKAIRQSTLIDLIANDVAKNGEIQCFYCASRLRGHQVEIDHIIPAIRGGTNDASNLVISCTPCNRNKGSSNLPDSFRTRINNVLRRQGGRDAI